MVNCSNISGEQLYVDAPLFQRMSIAQFREEFITISFYIHMIIIPVWILVGIVGNILSFTVWFKPKFRHQNSSAIYLAALSISDLALLLLYIIHFLQNTFDVILLKHPIICFIFQALFIFTQYFSVPLVLAFTLERWIAICYPFKRDILCTPKRACFIVGILGGFVSILGIIQGLGWTSAHSGSQCLFNENWQMSFLGRIYFSSVEILMSGILPVLTLVFNILVIKELRRITNNNMNPYIKGNQHVESISLVDQANNVAFSPSPKKHKNRETGSFRQTTTMLLTVSFYLIITTLSVGVCYIFQFIILIGEECLSNQMIREDPVWTRFRVAQMIKESIEALSISHYALNFLIYMLTSKAFRIHTLALLTCGGYKIESEEKFSPVRRQKPRQLNLGVQESSTYNTKNTI